MNKLKMHSPDLTQANIDKLADLFPNCMTEAAGADGVVKRSIDFDQLRQELSGSIVEGPQERYQLNWPGKREALLTANAPIAKTLRPCREESVNFDTTQNLFIEGDNLDALKLLQEIYLNKVKMIYIDPPYNTGKDFIYEDDFAEDSHSYLLRSAQRDSDGIRLIANTDSNGRFHSDWMSMMYGRLTLARRLLCDSGVIFISIDDNEVTNLKKICEEVFGSDNFVSSFIWKSKSGGANDSGLLAIDHEYVLCFARNLATLTFRLDTEAEATTNYNQEDGKGRYALERLDKQNLQYSPSLDYELAGPDGTPYRLEHKDIKNPNAIWRWSKDRVKREMADLVFKSGNVYTKNYEKSGMKLRSLLVDERFGRTRTGRADLDTLIPGAVFNNPKPLKLLQHFIRSSTDPHSLILDFFAGSASLAEAVLRQNALDGGNRKFIMIQVAEVCETDSAAFKSGFGTISEIGKQRIRRAGTKVMTDNSGNANIAKLDVGFRVLKIDTSNMKEVFYTPDAVSQDLLSDQVNNIREDRTAEDLLFQVLLDWGVDLALPISEEVIAGKTVYFVDGNALAACFDEGVDEDFVKLLAKREPLRVVFRDAGFASDSVKINVEQIFKLMSPSTEVKCI